MLRLVAFLACERVVVDSATNTVSISAIMEELAISVPQALLPVPAESAAPMSWSVFSMWNRDDNDPRTPFETKVELLLPSGRVALELPPFEQDFENFTKRSQRLISQINGFPIGEPGRLRLVLKCKMRGETEFVEVAVYPILLKHIADAVNENAVAAPAGERV